MSGASLSISRVARERNWDAVDSARLRGDFPILRQMVNGRRLVYLDSAASAQKPSPVLDAMRDLCESRYANVHRGVHTLSQRATEAFEAARGKVCPLCQCPACDGDRLRSGSDGGDQSRRLDIRPQDAAGR